MIAWRARPTRRVEHHMALVEAAVAEYADLLWQRAATQRLRWLRLVLRRIRPALERLIVIRTPGPEEILLEQLIRQAGLEFNPDLSTLADDLAELGRKIALQYGFLPNDPRTQTLEREFRRLLEGDLLSYWRTLTEPKALARQLVELREENRSTAQIIRAVQQEYGAAYFSAERLVRTLYNSGANRAQLEALRAAGYTHKRWLTARDSRVRTASKGHRFDHRRMEGVTVPLEQPFVTPAGSRLMYPGDRSLGAPAGEVVNCRCTIVGVVLEHPRFSSDDFNISAPPAKPRVQTWAPQGQPLRQALRVPRPDPYRQDSEVYELVLEAADLVHRVHGTGELPPVYVVNRQLPERVFAQYSSQGEQLLLDVQLGKTELIRVLEEFGHLIDNQAFTPGRYESIYSGDPRSPLARWRRAVEASQAVAELRAQRRAFQTYTHVGWEANDRAFVKYLLEPEELFARSYRQFVAVHSGDPRLLKAIGDRQNTPNYEIGYNIQWEDKDFEPIADALEKVFRRLGWIR